MSWMQKLRDARTTTDEIDVVTGCLEAFLDHFQGRSLWTDTMIPLQRLGKVVLTIKTIKGPEKSKVARGVHVHYSLAQRLVMFRTDTFLNFLWANHANKINEKTLMAELRKIYKVTTHKMRLCRGTQYMHAVPARIVAIEAPPGTLLERRLYGENTPAVENAMQVFEEALQRRRDREEQRAERRRAK